MQEPHTNSTPKNEGKDMPNFLLNMSVTRDLSQEIRFYNLKLFTFWTIQSLYTVVLHMDAV